MIDATTSGSGWRNRSDAAPFAGRLLLVVCAAALAAACGPEITLDPPAGWPQQWADRSLYHTPNGYIYASSNGAAGEADRFVGRQARAFWRQHDRGPAKGLIVVTDKDDEPYTTDLLSLAKIVAGDAVDQLPEGSLEEVVESKQAMVEDIASSLGFSTNAVCAVAALPLDREAVSGLIGIPADEKETFGWAAAVPTRDASRQVVQSAAKKYARDHLGLLLRVAVTPLIPLAVDRAVKELVAQWEETIDEQMKGADAQVAVLLSARRPEDPLDSGAFEDFTLDDLKPVE
ncbi:MAG: hypothetical protein ACYS15_02375 [Planctomycetota bacterium]|jgi:hypothetical protein